MVSKELTGSEIVLKALEEQGVTEIFGYPGGAVLPIYDAIFNQNQIRHILVRQEGGAVHAAEGYARSTGKVGIVLVTSGPGATNAVTGLTDALMDSIPIICLTGQVPTHLIGNDAFQEADTTGITRPCTKHNYLVKDVNDLARVMHEAFHVATSGRPGPVLIDLPKDVLMAVGTYKPKSKIKVRNYNPSVKGDLNAIKHAVETIAKAKKPLIYAGGGVINSGPAASKLLTQFVKMTGAPCTLTLMGLGAFPASNKQFIGMLGMHGTYEANLAMHDCDVMVCIGARFDDRVTGRLDAFSPGSTKIHVDIDPSSINKNVRVDIPIIGDVGHVLEDMIKVWKGTQAKIDAKALKAWWQEMNAWRSVDCLKFKQEGKVIKPQHALTRLWELCREAKKEPYVTTEVGQHQMWAAQHFGFEAPNKWLTSGGLGTMGYGFPAAIGAQMGNPDSITICIAGDASIQMNIQELGTATQYRLPVKIFILNNEYMGMVRQWQELTYESRYSNSYSDSLPDFVKLGEAYGWTGIRIEGPQDLESGIRQMLDTPGPVIVDCRVAKLSNCFPMIPSGAAHTDMLLDPNQIAGIMSDEAKALV